MSDVAQLIVIVSLPAEQIANKSKRVHFGIGVMGAEKQNPAMKQNQSISQRGQRKMLPRHGQNGESDQRWECF